MKNLSRLTALLLALMMLFTSMPAFATESEAIPVDEFEAADYASLLSIAEEDAAATADASWGNIFDGMPCADDNVFCQNVLHMLECPNAQERYEYLNSLYSGDGVDLEFTMLHYYFYHVEDQENMTDSVVCTCSFPFEEPEYVIPAPGDISKHDESCPWHFANLSLAEQYDVIRDMDADTQATYKETLSADALETLNRVNVSEYATGNVAISVPEGAFDEDYLLEVEPVTLTEEQLGLLFDAEASGFLSAFDITFAKLGEETTELQPAEGNPVNLDFSGLNDGLHVVYHLYETENGYEVEIVNLDNTVGGTIDASAEAFSIYIVTSTSSTSTSGTEVKNGNTYNMTVGDTVIFYWPQNSSSNRYTWDVYDVDGIISYEIAKNSAGAGAGGATNDWTYQAPWITITALKSGTNATLTIKSEDGTVETFYIAVSEKTDFHIENQVAKNGCLVPVGATSTEGTIEYTWTRSDGTIVRADALNTDGSVNISTDRGGVTNDRDPITYTVTATVTKDDGTVLETRTASYKVIYGQEILNPSFEYPEVERSANQYFFNGYPGLYWKTTAPGTGSNVTADVELSEKMSTYGYSNDTDYKAAHGDQFAELNAENFGALYQDILTTPGATLTWGFSHARRIKDIESAVNDMYVVMAATKDAQDILTEKQIDDLLDEIPSSVTPPSSGTGYKLTYNNEVYYIWYHDAGDNQSTWENISGSYTVPEGQYLTRLFFASNTNGNNSGSTLGNLIDATSAYETLTYRIEYYVDTKKVAEDPQTAARVYTYVDAAQLDNYLSQYTLTGVTVNGQPYPDDVTASDFKGFYVAPYRAQSGENDCLVVFRLYFKKNAVTVSKQVTVDNWAELSSTKQLALMNGYKATFGLYKSTDLENPVSTVTVPVTYVEGQDLIALGDFPLNGLLEDGTTYVVKEISATELSGYALTTTYGNGSSTYPNFVVTTNGYTENVTCLNAYTFKKGALTITKNVTDGAFPADGKTFTFTVTPTEEQDLSNWLEDNDYTKSGDGFVVNVNVGASKTASVTLAGLPAGKYNVVETADERYNTTYQVGSAAATTTSAVANVTQNGEANVIVTNTAKTGELTITKTVVDEVTTDGATPDANQAFTFTVELKDANGNALSDVQYKIGEGSAQAFDGTLTLTNGQKATFVNLPNGATYKVVETNIPVGYVVDAAEKSGTITANQTSTAAFTNTFTVDDLTIDKTITGGDNNTTDDVFTFNAMIGGTLYTGTYYVGGVAKEATDGKIQIKESEQAVIKDIPVDTTYSVSEPETEIPAGYTYSSGAVSDQKIATGDNAVVITNTYTTTTLTIAKSITYSDGNTADDVFSFNVTLPAGTYGVTGVADKYSVAGVANATELTSNGGAVAVTIIGQNYITIDKIPTNATYSVDETEVPTGYAYSTGEVTNASIGTEAKTVTITNIYYTSTLSISKVVEGTDAPADVSFGFTVELPNGTYNYTVGGETKTLTVSGGSGTLSLKNGQTAVISGIPVGATYTVAEDDYSASYTTTTTGNLTGELLSEGATVTFTNTYKYASLTITKKGVEDADSAATFVFEVKKGDTKVAEIVIAGNGSETITNLTVGDTYTVTETAGYWRYTLDTTAKTVVIDKDSTKNKVEVTNTKKTDQWLDGFDRAENVFN